MKLYTDNELTEELNKRAKYAEESAELRANPGVWGELEAAAIATAGNIRQGLLGSFKPIGDWEAKVRGGRVFVRYIGGTK